MDATSLGTFSVAYNRHRTEKAVYYYYYHQIKSHTSRRCKGRGYRGGERRQTSNTHNKPKSTCVSQVTLDAGGDLRRERVL